MNLQELGLVLQREREKKNLSIETVMEATKISRINLVALESGDRSALPHPVYTKGFVKSYARFLGLDSDELIMIVDREYQSEEQRFDMVTNDVSPVVDKAFQEVDAPAARRKRSFLPFVLVVLILSGVITLIVLSLDKVTEDNSADAPSSPAIIDDSAKDALELADPELEADALPKVAEADNASVFDGDELAKQQKENALAVPDAGLDKPEVKPIEKAEDVAAETGTPKLEKQKYDHVLIIRATTEKGCWIGVWKGDDTDMARDFVLKEGEPLRLMFNNPRRIRIGNASGVSVLYNGKKYPLDPAKGNIQTLRFGMN